MEMEMRNVKIKQAGNMVIENEKYNNETYNNDQQ